MNNKGFALTETLVVVVFLVSIFTFIYVSILPLIGKYENAINTEKDIDIVYKLYHVRKLIMSDDNNTTVTDSEVESINCSNLNKSTLCSKLMEQLDLRESNTDNYVIIYAKSLSATNIAAIKTINSEIGDYADKYKNNIATEALFLLDTKKHTVAHLYYGAVPICKRATLLHTETCTQASNYCYADGYYVGGSKNTTTITYGNLGTQGSLVTGDAFDCDVNGDGIYDSETERFYYISDRWTPGNNMEDNTFDSEYAVLIYYKNFYDGAPSDSGAAYANLKDFGLAGYDNISTIDNWHGPQTAYKHLPTTNYWKNVPLANTSRLIIGCGDGECLDMSSSTTGGTITPSSFSYSGKAARLLTLPELIKGCSSVNGGKVLPTLGSLSACNFLFENGKYSNGSKATFGPWLETPYTRSNNLVWWATGYSMTISINASYPVDDTRFGARPVIEVPYSSILY